MIGALLGGLGAIGGGIFGAIEQSNARGQAAALAQQTIDDYLKIGIPPVEAQRLALEEFRSAGQLTPELEAAITQGDSGMLGISTDPAYREAGMRALSKLQDIGTNGGMTLSDRANLERTMGDLQARERGSRQAILQDAAQRGGYGSGTALAAQFANAATSAQAARQSGLDIEGQAQDRALQALMQGGQLASQMRSQEFDEKAQAARAQDAINQWNAANRQGVTQRNVGYRNDAQAANLNATQNLMNQNTGLRNQQQQYNKELLQKNFENKMNLAGAKGNARANQAQGILNSSANMGKMIGGVAQGVGQAGAAYEAYSNTKKKPGEY